MAPALSRAETERVLTKKLGMVMDDRSHRYYVLVEDGHEIARTFVSKGTKYKTIPANLVSEMARQLYVTPAFLAGLVGCTKSKADYLSFRRANGTL